MLNQIKDLSVLVCLMSILVAGVLAIGFVKEITNPEKFSAPPVQHDPVTGKTIMAAAE